MDKKRVGELAIKHGLSEAAVTAMFDAMRRGGGSMAQFNHLDLGGMGQWSTGMLMIGDMFNDRLRGQVSALASDIAAHIKSNPSPSPERDVSYVAATTTSRSGWWPGEFGTPGSTGSQNGIRYAVFPERQRLVIEDAGTLTVYDTADHRIGGVGQAQGNSSTLSFTSQHGLIRVRDLRRM